MMTSSKALQVANKYIKILNAFPSEHLVYSFAYGSGVFKQTNNSASNMIDFIFVVDNAEKWHELNLSRNRQHYSTMCYFGPKAITGLQTNLASNMYFNSMVPVDDTVIKYGVISYEDLIADLLDWKYLYSAGRLHKPVQVVIPTSDSRLLAALRLNLHSAVHAALLLLPEYFTENQLYKTITSLSYTGDFRMTFGEDKNKVSNIVGGQMTEFRQLYAPVLKTLSDYVDVPMAEGEVLFKDGEMNCTQDISPSAKHHHFTQLPRTPQRRLVKYWHHSTGKRQDTEDVLRAVAHDLESNQVLNNILTGIVWDSSVKQSLKGILTAGFLTSIKYSAKKIGKMLRSLRRSPSVQV